MNHQETSNMHIINKNVDNENEFKTTGENIMKKR
jgi:hypothetical protein